MKSTSYSIFSLWAFRWFISDERKERLEEKNLLLEKANINIDYPEFFAWSLMNILVSFIVSLVFSIVFHMLLNSLYSLLLLIFLPMGIPCIV